VAGAHLYHGNTAHAAAAKRACILRANGAQGRGPVLARGWASH